MSPTLLDDPQIRLRADALINEIPDPVRPSAVLRSTPLTQRRRPGMLPMQIGLAATVGLVIAGVVTFTVLGNSVAPDPAEAQLAATEQRSGDPIAPAPASDVRIIDPANPAPVEIAAPAQSSAAVFGAAGGGNDTLTATPGVVLVGGEQMEMADGVVTQAVVASAVNMRAGPDSGAAVLMVLPAGAVVGLFGCDYWCQVSYAGTTGWVYQDFLALTR